MRLRPSRMKTGILALLCVGILALGIGIATLGDSFSASLGLLVGVLFGLFPLIYLLLQMIHPIEWWELTPEGITSHALGKPLTTRWDDFEELAFWRFGRLGQKKVLIKTRSGREREARDKMFARRVKTQQGYHVIIPASQFSISAEEFFDLLQHYWKDYGAREELGGGNATTPDVERPQVPGH